MIIVWILVWIVTGAFVVSGAVLGLAWYVSKLADHSPNCQCEKCQKARLRKPHPWKAVEDGTVVPRPNTPRSKGEWEKDEKNKQVPSGGVWISTLQLRTGMRVLGRTSGSIYRVVAVDVQPYGYKVRLVNERTERDSFVPVQQARAAHRIWLVRKSRGSVG